VSDKKINFSDLPESFDPKPIIDNLKKHLSSIGLDALCKSHEYESMNGRHICKRCGKRRGIVLISDETYRRAGFTAKGMGLRPQAWKYIPLSMSDSKRMESMCGIRIESEHDLVGIFYEHEKQLLLAHLPKDEEE